MTDETCAGGSDERVLRRARLGVTAMFVLFGIALGSWGAHIPVLQARLDFSPAVLGLVLVTAGVGALIAQPLLGVLMSFVGSKLPVIVASVLVAVVIPALILAPNMPALFMIAALMGVFFGGLNVAMNTQGSRIEVLRGRPTMSGLHAGASFGMLAGSTASGAMMTAGWADGEAALMLAALMVPIGPLLRTTYLDDKRPPGGAAFVMPTRAVLGLGALAFLMFLVEGGIIDWSALFLALEKGAAPGIAALGIASFTGAVGVARLAGNRLIARAGRGPVLVSGGVLVAVGMALAASAHDPLVAMAGFALAGLGAGNIIPILMSAAAELPGVAPSVSIGAVATMMSLGLLVGPPMLGYIAHGTSLTVAILVMSAIGALVAATALTRLRAAF